MNWADEPYIKLYTRDTVEYKLLPWQGRCILPLIMRKLDRAGVMDIGKYSPSEAVSTMVDMPIAVVKVGIEALLKAGTVEVVNGALVCPKFLEAQEARQSNKARQATFRQRHKDQAQLEEVTKRYELVTESNAASHEVTNRIEENRIEENRVNPLPPVVPDIPDSTSWQSVIRVVADTTGQVMDHNSHKVDAQAILRLATQLNGTDPAITIKRAVKAWWADEWVQTKRPPISHLAKNFDKYANAHSVVDKDTLATLKRAVTTARQDWELEKSQGNESTVARAQSVYDKATQAYKQVGG